MITQENENYNTKTFQVEYDLTHKTIVTEELFKTISREDIIELMVETYKRDLEMFLNEKMHS
jgi:hypothetical protein